MTEEEQLDFGGDCSVGCMHKQGCENEEASNILQRIQHTLY